jgi:hypothetical protein
VGLIHLNLLYNFPFDIKMRTKKLHISFKTVSGSVFLSSALVRHPLLIRFQLLPASNRSSTVALQQLHLRQLQLHSLSQHTAADGDAPVMPAIPLFLWWAPQLVTVILQHNYTAAKLFALPILLFIQLTCYTGKKKTHTG